MSARQYIITAPTGFAAASGRFRDDLSRVHNERPVPLLESVNEDGDKLALMTPEDAQRLKAQMSGLVIEPNILYQKYRHPLLEGFEEIVVTSTNTRRVMMRVTGSGPVAGVTVYLVLDRTRNLGLKGVTDANGECSFTVRESTTRYDYLALLPRSGYWNRKVAGGPLPDALDVALRPLPSPDPERYDWGHVFAEMRDGLADGGHPVKIGVIDTGIRKDHPDLKPAGGRNCVYGESQALWDADEDGHGTHCAGVIAAVANGKGLKGYAPRAELRAYRVFATGADGATAYDIANAIRQAIDDGCDVLSMSLGSSTPSTAIRNKIERAYDRGVLCVAATGNEGGAVGYPAAFPTVVGVGAFGKLDSYPADSLHTRTESGIRSADGQYYVANFSNFGEPHVDFCAPGVAIQSTVPGKGYSAWDGTSMACPQVTGMAALALAANPDILGAAPDAGRVERLVELLRGAARPLGFGAAYEGAGCLNLSQLL